MGAEVSDGIAEASGDAEIGGIPMKDNVISYFDGRITVHPDICNGKPTIRGKRITAQTVLEFLSAGESPEEILHQYPSLEPEDIKMCLEIGKATS